MISVCVRVYSHAVTKQRDSSKAGLTKLLLASVRLSKVSPLVRCLWLRPADLQRCVFYEVPSEGTNESWRANVSVFSQAPYSDAWQIYPASRDPFLFLHFTICAFILSLLLLKSTASSYRADLRGEITLNDCESLF